MKLRILAVVCIVCAIVSVVLDASLLSQSDEVANVAQTPTVDIVTPVEKRRAEEQTFLTFPEWFLVYSPEEYGEYVQEHPPSGFPFLEHLGQFWRGYAAIHQATIDAYPFNGGYHLMVMVIGTSTTVEYAMKWAYEATVGRLTEASRRHGTTAEDRLNADIAREYAAFLNGEPWYKFDYVDALRRLWTETGLWGPDPLRKWERKYALTTEFAMKAVYAKLLRQGSESAYGVVETVTTCVIDRLPEPDALEAANVSVIEQYPDGTALVDLPRYHPFMKSATILARHDVGFVEIAGNRETILVSAIVPETDHTQRDVLMTQPTLTRPERKRIVFEVPVADLKATILMLREPGARLEHIYDY